MAKASEGVICELKVIVKRDWYDGLWNLVYVDGTRYAGPYKTRREAIEILQAFEQR